MSKELVISANRHETRVAILEDDQLVEIYFQRANEYSLAGSIHKGRVTRVLPGMQSAFVDLGLERDTFLYVSDFFEENDEYDRILPGKDEKPMRTDRADKILVEAIADVAPPEPEVVVRETKPVVEAAPAVVEAGGPPKQAPTSAGNQPGRDDRGRRSRRRRNRGRGFPDSKYASEVNETTEPIAEGDAEPLEMETAVEPEPEVVAEPQVTEAAYSFPVLPGESLAKYRKPVTKAVPVEAEEPLEKAEAPVAEAVAEPLTEAVPEPESVAAAAPEPEPAPEPEAIAPPPVQPLEEAILSVGGAAPAREPEPDPVVEEVSKAAPVAEAAVNEEPVAPVPVAEPEPEPIPAAEVIDLVHEADTEREAEAEAVSEIIAEAREGGRFSPEEIADSPVPGVELLLHEGTETMTIAVGEDCEEEGDEAEASGEEIPDSTEAVAEGDAAAAPLNAHVREQGGRYMHRVPRRMRRKSRGGGGGGTAPVAEAGAVAAPPPAPKPEIQRTEAPRVEQQRTVVRPEKERVVTPLITELLKEGQEIIVQIAKEPLGQKGARITSHIALPGRYVVFMPTLDHMGVSRKIASDEERLRLKKILQAHRVGIQGGFIVRTAGEGRTEEEIAADMNFLANLWLDIRQKAERKPAPLLLHHDLDIVQRILRDQVTDSFKAIWVDNEDAYESILRFVQRFQPMLVTRVKMYTRSAPIFDAFGITPELEKALRPKVWLKSGGYIVINQTEALVAIDVNTGKYVGKSNRLEDTIVKTNTEAVKEIVRQIRLRDLGGIIVVDFIDMDERKNRAKVMQVLEEAMRADKAPYKILQFNDFGLVAITRKRVKQSLERALCSPCPYCEGAGYVKSVSTTVAEILQEAHKIARAVEGKDVLLRVHPEVAKYLKSNQNKYLEEMEEILRRPVLVKSDPLLHQEKFDLA